MKEIEQLEVKKPKLLELKIELAELIKEDERFKGVEDTVGGNWAGSILIDDFLIRVFVKTYPDTPWIIDNVDLTTYIHNNLPKSQIIKFIKILKNGRK